MGGVVVVLELKSGEMNVTPIMVDTLNHTEKAPSPLPHSFKTTIEVEVFYSVEPAQRGCKTDPSWKAHVDEIEVIHNGQVIDLDDSTREEIEEECQAHMEEE